MCRNTSRTYNEDIAFAIQLAKRPIVPFSLQSSENGYISILASDSLYVMMPKRVFNTFDLLSVQLNLEEESKVKANILEQCKSKFLKQKSLSEVDLVQPNSSQQMELSVDVNKLYSKDLESMRKIVFIYSEWSPLGIYFNGSCLLATLTSLETINIYTSEHKSSCKLILVLNLSELLLEHLASTAYTCPSLNPLSHENSFMPIIEQLQTFSFTSLAWSSIIYSNFNPPSAFFTTGTKNGCVLFWKFMYPLHLSIVDNIKFKLEYRIVRKDAVWVNCICWSEVLLNKYIFVAFGLTDGTVLLIKVDILSNQFKEVNLSKDPDFITVKQIKWIYDYIKNKTSLFVLKGSSLLIYSFSYVLDTCLPKPLYYILDLTYTHPITGLHFTSNGKLLVLYQNTKVSLFNYSQTLKQQIVYLVDESDNFNKLIMKQTSCIRFPAKSECFGITFSPNSIFCFILCFSSLIGIGRPSKLEIANSNKLVSFSVLTNEYLNSLGLTNSKLIPGWDLVHFFQTEFKGTYLNELSISMLNSLNNQLRLQIDILLERSRNIIRNDDNTELLQINIKKINEMLTKTSFKSEKVRNLLSLNIDIINNGMHFDRNLKCEVCQYLLKVNDKNKSQFICENNHIFPRCVFTLKLINIGVQHNKCNFCDSRANIAIISELYYILKRNDITLCPLCSGYFLITK